MRKLTSGWFTFDSNNVETVHKWNTRLRVFDFKSGFSIDTVVLNKAMDITFEVQ